MYIILAIIGYTLLGIVALLDKFILSKKVSHPLTYTFYIVIAFLFLFFLLPFGVRFPTDFFGWLIISAGGFFFFFGLWFMYIGVQKSEISHVGPLVGAVIPLGVLLLSRFFLHEYLPVEKLFAISLLVLGSFIISFEKSKKHNGIHWGMLWGVLAGLAFAVSHVSSKIAYTELGFYSGLVLTRFVLGFCGLLVLLFVPIVRREVFQKRPAPSQRQHKGIIVINLLLSTVAVLLTQYAIAIGSVSIVNAFEGLKYAVLIVLVALLSKFYPRILKEDYSRWEMVQETLAVILIACGLVLLI